MASGAQPDNIPEAPASVEEAAQDESVASAPVDPAPELTQEAAPEPAPEEGTVDAAPEPTREAAPEPAPEPPTVVDVDAPKISSAIMNQPLKRNVYRRYHELVTPPLHKVVKPPPTSFGTIFGKIHEDNVTFCLDTSGSMIDFLDALKEQLIEVLTVRSSSERETMFNIVEFSTSVKQWSDKMVRCTPQTVAVAAEWIKALQPQTGTNTQEALLTALSDGNCEAVYLITDGLPDQHPSDVLDNVIYAAQNRPIHCYYIQDGHSESSALNFLKELAMDSYGSFHVITIAKHGSIERVTPVYRADTSAERIVRTTSGNIIPSNHKVCNVSTRHGFMPPVMPAEPGPVVIQQPPSPLHPYHLYPWPYRYYYHYYHPYTGWSRYRTARALLKHEEDFYNSMISISPGAGALVVDTIVLARRKEDGLFYKGRVKSQMMSEKFLIEFGPCNHGKYKDTSYQETLIYDIVSYDDAMRHTILVGDKVLAPWEPDGEKYGPGVVIEGQEQRMARDGTGDVELVVAFNNGKTASVPFDRAVWIPSQLHERITFEMQLPSHVRREFAEQEQYPEENLPGYPTSGPIGHPAEFEVCDPHWLDNNRRVLYDRVMYRYPYYVPHYPVYFKYQPKESSVKSEDVEQLIPGTEMTKSELNEKIMSQLMEHKLTTSDKDNVQEKLLHKREELQDKEPVSHKSSILKKSVTFDRTPDSDLEGEYDAGDLDMRDSGRGSEDDMYLSDVDGYGSTPEDKGTQTSRTIGVGPDGKMFFRRRFKKRSERKPRWKYWGNDPAPSLMDPMHYGPHRVGPYDSTCDPIPLETRQSKGQWTSPFTQVVDPYASYKYDGSVADSMRMPHPPEYKPEKQGPGREISEILGTPLTEKDQLADYRRSYRRNQSLQRELKWMEGLEERERMRLSMEDQHRSRVQARIDADRQKRAEEHEMVQRSREVKKQIGDGIRERIEENQRREQERSEQVDAARRNNRLRREEIAQQKQREIEETVSRRQAIREQRAKARFDAVQSRLADEEVMNQAVANQRRQASYNRRLHFRELEAEAQRRKYMQAELADIKRGHYRSQVLP